VCFDITITDETRDTCQNQQKFQFPYNRGLIAIELTIPKKTDIPENNSFHMNVFVAESESLALSNH
jgi:hypothetical protein